MEYSGDYYLNDWHEYLKEKYHNNIDELNEAYGEKHASFDEIDYVRTNHVILKFEM